MLTFAWLCVLAIIQLAVLPSFSLLGHVPDLVFLAVVARAILYGRQQGIIWGAVGGAILDLLSIAPFGTHILALIVVGMVTSYRGRDIVHSWAFYPLLAGGLATILFDLVVMLVLTAMRWDAGWLGVPLNITFPRLLLNALCMGPIFWLAYRNLPRGRGGEIRSLGI